MGEWFGDLHNTISPATNSPIPPQPQKLLQTTEELLLGNDSQELVEDVNFDEPLLEEGNYECEKNGEKCPKETTQDEAENDTTSLEITEIARITVKDIYQTSPVSFYQYLKL